MKSGKEILDEVLLHTKETINSLAKSIGLKRSQNLYDIESGKVKRISPELSEKIVKVFPDINRDYLLTGIGEMFLTETPKDTDTTVDTVLQGSYSKKTTIKPIADLTAASATHSELVHAHRLQAETNLSQTRQGESLVETNRMLVSLLANSAGKLKNPPTPFYPSGEMLEKAARKGLGKTFHWTTVEKGQELLGKLLIGDYKAKKE